MTIIISLLVLGVIVFIHEFGHFASAKLFKMPVSDFSIGMGTKVISLQTSKTEYNLRAFPIGGHVNIDGMEEDDEVENGFNTKPAYQRFIVLIAGVFMNFLLAFVILFLAFKIDGITEIDTRPIIGSVTNESINYNILKEGDKILYINDIKINSWEEISKNLAKKFDSSKINLKIERDGEEKNIEASLIYDEKSNRSFLGIGANVVLKKLTFKESIYNAYISFKNIFLGIFSGFAMLFKGEVSPKELSGPIGIFQIIGQVSRSGFYSIAVLTALISINIGVLNLIPLPALDGGRLFFVLLEMFKIKISKKIEENIHRLGIIILFTFIIAVSINDIVKIFS